MRINHNARRKTQSKGLRTNPGRALSSLILGAGGNWREQKRSFSLHSRIEVTMMANRQGKLTDLLLREEGMGGRKGNLCNGWIPRVWGEQIEQIALRVNQKFLPKLKSARTNNKTRNAMSFPMIKTLIQFTHKSNPERLKNYDENVSGYSSIYIISWIMISRGCFGFWLIS